MSAPRVLLWLYLCRNTFISGAPDNIKKWYYEDGKFSKAGIYAMTFDNSGSRLITCETDKTIKFYKEAMPIR